MNSKGQETCYCYDAYDAVDAFYHCKVARGKLGWEQLSTFYRNNVFY